MEEQLPVLERNWKRSKIYLRNNSQQQPKPYKHPTPSEEELQTKAQINQLIKTASIRTAPGPGNVTNMNLRKLPDKQLDELTVNHSKTGVKPKNTLKLQTNQPPINHEQNSRKNSTTSIKGPSRH